MKLITPTPSLILPMHMRRIAPMGYVHGQVNWQGVLHPGYDLNDGAGGWADLGQKQFAPEDSLIKYSGPAGGWGTLMVGYFAEKLGGEWLGWRIGHSQKLYVGAGERVRKGQLIGTCGNGNQPGMLPHTHFDMFRRAELEELGSVFVSRYGQKEADRVHLPWAYWDLKGVRNNFAKLYVDPADYFPEIASVMR